MDKITGIMIYYYFVCHRKLWYHLKGLNLERENEDVNIGKLIDENFYKNENKHINIDGTINIDFLKKWRVVHDIKKSKSIEEASRWQMKYYLYYLQSKGVNVEKGLIDYPLLKEREEVYLLEEDIQKIENIIKEILEIKALPYPPKLIKISICPKCSYYEYCFC